MRLRPALLIALCTCLNATFTLAARLPEPLAAAMQSVALPPDALAYAIVPLDRKSPSLNYQAQRSVQPGSTMKLVTTIVALDKLGINHRAKTELRISTRPEAGVLQGDVYLVGGGDPDLDWPALWQLLRQLRESGVRELRGDFVLDRSLFQPERADIGLPPFDEAPEFAYNVIPDALHLNGSLLEFRLSSEDGVLRASTSPVIDQLDIDTSAITLTDTPCKDWEEIWRLPQVENNGELRRIVLQELPRQCKVSEPLNLLERDWLAQKVISKLWREMGGSLRGTVKAGRAPSSSLLVATHRGRPLAEVIRNMNKQSDNAITRLVYLALGTDPACKLDKTADCAADSVRQWLKQHDIDDTGLVLDNGSGLSRSERISPRLLAEMLAAAWRGQHADELRTSMPIAGVDGTMRRRLGSSPAAGWARLKTGTLSGVTGLAGYVRDEHDRYWAVSVMINHPGSDATANRKVLDTLIDWIARSDPAAQSGARRTR